VLTATLTEERIMAEERMSSASAIRPTVCDIKIRLVASLYFNTMQHGRLLTMLYKSFAQNLADIARAHAFGCKGKPNPT
jgi:hypothetical protein